MNVSKVLEKDYEKVRLLGRPKNKPNSNPIKPNFKTGSFGKGFD